MRESKNRTFCINGSLNLRPGVVSIRITSLSWEYDGSLSLIDDEQAHAGQDQDNDATHQNICCAQFHLTSPPFTTEQRFAHARSRFARRWRCQLLCRFCLLRLGHPGLVLWIWSLSMKGGSEIQQICRLRSSDPRMTLLGVLLRRICWFHILSWYAYARVSPVGRLPSNIRPNICLKVTGILPSCIWLSRSAL